MQHRSRVPTNQRFREGLVRAARHICREGALGLWQDARTSATAIWGLSLSGILNAAPDFRHFCLTELLSSDQCLQGDSGICFNREVWDTSIALLAVEAAGKPDHQSEISKIRTWLGRRFATNNVNHEPWETLWALHSLLQTDSAPKAKSQLYVRSLRWLLGCRSVEGVLIGPHYMGFLLQVIAAALGRVPLDSDTRKKCAEAGDIASTYLRGWFERGSPGPQLSGVEPWSLGHILSGVSSYRPATSSFIKWTDFNEKLANWLEQNWDDRHGWVDTLDTVCAYVGLFSYYLEYEKELRQLSGPDVHRLVEAFASKVNFRFRPHDNPMRVTPLWGGRHFKRDAHLCFILMPFRERWSDELNRLIKRTLARYGITALRADDLYDPDVMEDVWKGINCAAAVIVDCSRRNANVFYELGIAHTIGRKTIVLVQDEKDIPFDIRKFRYIKYKVTKEGKLTPEKANAFRDELVKHLSACMDMKADV